MPYKPSIEAMELSYHAEILTAYEDITAVIRKGMTSRTSSSWPDVNICISYVNRINRCPVGQPADGHGSRIGAELVLDIDTSRVAILCNCKFLHSGSKGLARQTSTLLLFKACKLGID